MKPSLSQPVCMSPAVVAIHSKSLFILCVTHIHISVSDLSKAVWEAIFFVCFMTGVGRAAVLRGQVFQFPINTLK